MSNNSFLVNNMTRAYYGILESQMAGARTMQGMDFKEMVEELDKRGGVASFSRENMSLEKYKQYIYQKISQIPIHPSQQAMSAAVHITDAGFEAMRKDPEYEKWVLDVLRQNFGASDPWAGVCGESFSVHRFGATPEEYRGDKWYTGFRGGKGSSLFDTEAEDSFWEKRRKRHKKYIKLQQEIADKKKTLEHVYQEAAVRRGDYEHMYDFQGIMPMIPVTRLMMNIDKKVK
ncbi:MAG: hypothetical protein NC400_03195 [Clostridium sp.]|nr:hypothetical protein [Clostridium sp.]